MAPNADDRLQRDAQLATELQREIGVEHIAGVYAEALLGAAEGAGQTGAVLEEVDSLVADVLGPQPEFERILTSDVISHEERSGILDRVLGERASPLVMSFLKVLSRHGRMGCLRAIAAQAHAIHRQKLGEVAVQVTTAAPLGQAAAQRLREALQPLLGGTPVLHERVDPAVIGGLVVRVGDTIYDASVARQLETVRQQMIDRSAHEIQSRRDRFRPPAGN
jgi:F-type H+-transporting ATPase subunit delta